MKNIHVLPTDKPSRLHLGNSGLVLCEFVLSKYTINGQHISITSDEEINLNNYITDGYRVWKWKDDSSLLGRKKVILTTDTDLIKDGVQPIDDEFLEWFIKNPSCESVEFEKGYLGMGGFCKSNEIISKDKIYYKIIIPQEEPKQEPCDNCGNDVCCCIIRTQETLEEAAEFWDAKQTILEFEKSSNRPFKKAFEQGAKWQAERMYTYDELRQIAYNTYCKGQLDEPTEGKFNLWIQQFKKK